MRTIHGADVTHCGWRSPRGPDGTLWPATARSEALRRFDEVHPRHWCTSTSVAIMTLSGPTIWEAGLCQEHAKLFAWMDGRVTSTPKEADRITRVYPLDGYPDLERRPVRRARTWAPKQG